MITAFWQTEPTPVLFRPPTNTLPRSACRAHSDHRAFAGCRVPAARGERGGVSVLPTDTASWETCESAAPTANRPLPVPPRPPICAAPPEYAHPAPPEPGIAHDSSPRRRRPGMRKSPAAAIVAAYEDDEAFTAPYSIYYSHLALGCSSDLETHAHPGSSRPLRQPVPARESRRGQPSTRRPRPAACVARTGNAAARKASPTLCQSRAVVGGGAFRAIFAAYGYNGALTPCRCPSPRPAAAFKPTRSTIKRSTTLTTSKRARALVYSAANGRFDRRPNSARALALLVPSETVATTPLRTPPRIPAPRRHLQAGTLGPTTPYSTNAPIQCSGVSRRPNYLETSARARLPLRAPSRPARVLRPPPPSKPAPARNSPRTRASAQTRLPPAPSCAGNPDTHVPTIWTTPIAHGRGADAAAETRDAEGDTHASLPPDAHDMSGGGPKLRSRSAADSRGAHGGGAGRPPVERNPWKRVISAASGREGVLRVGGLASARAARERNARTVRCSETGVLSCVAHVPVGAPDVR
ncbi:hypothetical protein B0H15DRAFT_993953 [Mycena belliarum]|uniref:Uncharacterized protein n=1 Tax=Mycena belliarum TaxID=1033014 RepID=A0AAD6XMV1_9AGAR|nr:hypothetical protein B0H15DRAFT_993953 [Mycena belliae]